MNGPRGTWSCKTAVSTRSGIVTDAATLTPSICRTDATVAVTFGDDAVGRLTAKSTSRDSNSKRLAIIVHGADDPTVITAITMFCNPGLTTILSPLSSSDEASGIVEGMLKS